MGIEGATWGLGTREGEGFSIYIYSHFKASLYRVARGGVRDTCASGLPHEGVAHEGRGRSSGVGSHRSQCLSRLRSLSGLTTDTVTDLDSLVWQHFLSR